MPNQRIPLDATTYAELRRQGLLNRTIAQKYGMSVATLTSRRKQWQAILTAGAATDVGIL